MDYGITPLKVEEDQSDVERLFVEEGYLNEENMVGTSSCCDNHESR